MTMIKLPYVQEYRDRHGKVRRYFRRPGYKRVALPGTPGSPAFNAAYESALVAERPLIGEKPGEGTICDLVTSFYRSPYFENLKPQSQRLYRLVLDKFAEQDGHRLVRDMPRKVAMNEEIGATRPGMANLTLKAMRRLFAYAIKREMRQDNPFVGIESYKLGSHHTWTDAELAAYESVWKVGTRERLAFDLLLYTGQRVSDVAAMRRSDIRNGDIHLRPKKTGDDLVVPQVIPLHPNLLRSMKAYPAKGLSLVGQANGRPISGQGLSSVIERAARVAGLPEKCVPHGIRKARMRRLAERGATTKEIASVSGHKTLKEVERYTVAADQAKLARAAMAREEQTGTDDCLT
jgi:integrase